MSESKKEIIFRTEIEFRGTMEEFQEVSAKLAELPIKLRVELPSDHTKGCWPFPIEGILSKRVMEKVIDDMPRYNLVKDIYGGIRIAHLHIGDDLVLLDRERFQNFVGQLAMEIGQRIAAKADYTTTVGAIHGLVKGAQEAQPIELP
jgi:hypothetical protein